MPSSKPFTVIACDQRSPEWMAARLGRLTGSKAADAFSTTKAGAFTAERKNLRTQLVLERLTGKSAERPVSGYQVRDGIAREPHARFHYECVTGQVVREVGFCADNEIPVGCSPDGVIGDFDGLVSLKSPLAATHLNSLQALRAYREGLNDLNVELAMLVHKSHTAIVPSDYLMQIRHELYVTGASWCDYVSYDGSFPVGLQSVTVRVSRADMDLAAYERDVQTFLAEVDAEYVKVKGWAA